MKLNTLTLLKIGRSNWDYYLESTLNLVIAKAKPKSGASDCYFGSMTYYKKWNADEL